LDEILDLVDEARTMGCREWNLSGGEPMLRSDFPEILDYVTRRSARYSLNTNGTLITPRIAQLMRRKGNKMVALYGATAEIHDHITRHPRSFEATMRGMAYLREAGAGFTVQLVPLRDNYHQWHDMTELAQSLSPHWRVGAAWLYLSACGNPVQNLEIQSQRLEPRDVIELDKPDPSFAEWATTAQETEETHTYQPHQNDDRLFAACVGTRRDFHVDPYGGMTFCCFIKDPDLIYDLRQGSFQEAWEAFVPDLADQVRGGTEYLENCARCELRSDCRWCPVYGYLEHRRFSAPVEYLCAVAQEKRRFEENWRLRHRRHYRIAGVTIQVDSDLPITDTTFSAKFEPFRADGPGEDTVTIRHHFTLPDLQHRDLGEPLYRRPPWAIHRFGNTWVYLGISPDGVRSGHLHRVVVFNTDHTRAHIYHNGEALYRRGNLSTLTLFPTDQILLARLLADRQGCYLHSSAAILSGQGLVFVGHSEAGKSTMIKMLTEPGHFSGSPGSVDVLCDDRNIVRRWPEGFRVHGTWSHGEVPLVSAGSAPLRAILFLEQATENRLISLDGNEIVPRLLACLIKPFVTADWWEKTLDLVQQMAQEVPCYALRFDKSGAVVQVLKQLCNWQPNQAEPS
jgi:MoaA/NifB/PqqE/SkfB family radical SAM enzyme